MHGTNCREILTLVAGANRSRKDHPTTPAWWHYQMEAFSALLALCAGKSPVTSEFPSQRPVTRGFEFFFDLRLNKWLSKQSWGWWFETPSHQLWRHCNENTTTAGWHKIDFNNIDVFKMFHISTLSYQILIDSFIYQCQDTLKSNTYQAMTLTIEWYHKQRLMNTKMYVSIHTHICIYT